MTKPPPMDDSNNRIVAVTLDEESIGRSGPDIEHERAIAVRRLPPLTLGPPVGDELELDALDAGRVDLPPHLTEVAVSLRPPQVGPVETDAAPA